MWSIQNQIKIRKELKNFKQTGDSRCIYQKELDKVCLKTVCLFETYEHFKDLSRRTIADKVLCDKAFNIAKNPKYDGYQCGFASMVYK